jgi:hypothetical protein
VKRSILFLAGLFLSASLSVKADVPIFGNSINGNADGFSLSSYNQYAFSGGAVEFTPQENIDLSSVDLWLAGYTGQQSISVSIWDNNPAGTGSDNLGTASSFPWAQVINFSSAAPNDGTLAQFTFSNPSANLFNDPSGSTVLLADTNYWLVVTAEGKFGSSINTSTWVGGGTPTGGAIYDASASYNISGGSFDASSDMPAFSINTDSSLLIAAVPEPSSAALMALPFLAGIGRVLVKRWKSRS